MKVYDGEKCIIGRVASQAAQDALKGEKVEIYNAEKLIFTGNKKPVIEKYKHRRSLRDHAKPVKSPKFPRIPTLFVKRIIRGMLPWRSKRGKEAFRKIKVYNEVPEKGTKKIYELKKDIRFVTVKQVCKELGWNK